MTMFALAVISQKNIYETFQWQKGPAWGGNRTPDSLFYSFILIQLYHRSPALIQLSYQASKVVAGLFSYELQFCENLCRLYILLCFSLPHWSIFYFKLQPVDGDYIIKFYTFCKISFWCCKTFNAVLNQTNYLRNPLDSISWPLLPEATMLTTILSVHLHNFEHIKDFGFILYRILGHTTILCISL